MTVQDKLGSCWLITWVGTNTPKTIAAILSARRGERDVATFVERLYAATRHDLSDQMAQARYKKPHVPYPARIERGRINCGHNPWLYARQVRNMTVEINDDGEEIPNWEEPPPLKPFKPL